MLSAMPKSRYVFGQLPWYSVLILTGILCALALCSHEEKRRGLPRDTVLDLALWVIPLGVVCARLYYVAFSWPMFEGNPVSILHVWEGGLAIYGGVLGGLIGVFLFSVKRKISTFLLTDMIVPALALAQSIGRWGNYFNMEAYGPVITDPAWQFFPAGVLIIEGGEPIWHMATFFYESLWNSASFLILWFVIRKHSKRTGTLTLCYMLIYGTGRFLIEGLRMDSLMSGNIRISQLLSLLLAAAAAAMLLFRGIIHTKAPQKEVS